MKKIMRLTRHFLTEDQLEALEDTYGEGKVNIVHETESLPSSPREAVAKFDEMAAQSFADIAEVVLPVNLLEAVLKHSDFVKNGGIIIRSVMNRQVDSEGNATFTFSHYEKVKEVNIVTEPL
jgi:hypothetical protein